MNSQKLFANLSGDESMPRTYLASHPIYDPYPVSTLRRLSTDMFDSAREVVIDAPYGLSKGRVPRQCKIELYQNHRIWIIALLNEPGFSYD